MDRPQLLKAILQENRIETLFQPIVDLSSGSVLGYEALSRGPQNSPLYSPVSLIEEARAGGLLCELDAMFAMNALWNAGSRRLQGLLFVNFETILCSKGGIYDILAQSEDYGIPADRIVLEVNERTNPEILQAFHDQLQTLKASGIRTASDDFGIQNANYDLIRMLKPDFLKIDRALIREIDKDPFAESVLYSLLMLSEMTGMKVIVEGVETREELETLQRLGVGAVQGYFLGMPEKIPGGLRTEAAELIGRFAQKHGDRRA